MVCCWYHILCQAGPCNGSCGRWFWWWGFHLQPDTGGQLPKMMLDKNNSKSFFSDGNPESKQHLHRRTIFRRSWSSRFTSYIAVFQKIQDLIYDIYFLVKIIFAARVPSLLVFLASLYLTLQMVNNPKTVFNWFWFCFSSSFIFQLIISQVACFMVTEPSIDEELVPKSEDVNGNQEILMDQVLSKSSFLLPSL